MKYDAALNELQLSIMRQLFTRGVLRFSEINTQDVPSDQFSYHLRQLIKYDLVHKTDAGTYELSVAGRSRAIMLDTTADRFIEQGFIACRVILSREHNGTRQYLVQRRSKVPYNGYLSEPGGKIMFGEDVIDAAVRNMLFETGLKCTMKIRGMVHFKDQFEARTVQDKFFFVVHATNPQGELLPFGDSGENIWMTTAELAENPKTHQGVVDMIRMAESGEFIFDEQTHTVAEY